MKKLLFASLFCGVYLSGMGMQDIETLRIISHMCTQKKKTSKKHFSMDSLKNQNKNKNYQTMPNDNTSAKRESEETNWRSLFLFLCCIPQNR